MSKKGGGRRGGILMQKPYRAEHAPSWWMAKGITPGQGGRHNAMGVDLPPTDPKNNLPIKAMFPSIEDTSTEFGIQSRPGITVSSRGSNAIRNLTVQDGQNLLPSEDPDPPLEGVCPWTPRKKSVEYYSDNCCNIQSINNIIKTLNRVSCGVLNNYSLYCDTPENTPDNMNNFIYWYMIWLLVNSDTPTIGTVCGDGG